MCMHFTNVRIWVHGPRHAHDENRLGCHISFHCHSDWFETRLSQNWDLVISTWLTGQGAVRIFLPLPARCGIKGMFIHAQLLMRVLVVQTEVLLAEQVFLPTKAYHQPLLGSFIFFFPAEFNEKKEKETSPLNCNSSTNNNIYQNN